MLEIVKIKIQNELDIVLAYKRAKQLSEYTGLNISNQTKFSTAVSEICRNVLEHVGEGTIIFNIIESGQIFLEAVVSDTGMGIKNIDEVLNRKFTNVNVKGCGIVNSNKLVDQFLIETQIGLGTKVKLRKKIAFNHPPINKKIIEGWKEHFFHEKEISPYDEIKKQNNQLIEVMNRLRIKHLETEAQMEEIKRLNTDLDKFAYTVSHDLKAPLKNMEAIITMLEDCMVHKDIEDAQANIAILKSQTERMDKLIQHILEYAKNGKKNILKKEIAVQALVTEVINTLKIPNGISIQINPDLPTLFTEEVLLSQVFSNLIGNAIKYHDKPNGEIIVDFEKELGTYVFTVQDDGPGIHPDDAAKIFRLFQPLQIIEGSTGIGLSIVKDIVNEKGGKVWMESQGRGTKFLFSWPEEIFQKEVL